MSAKRRRNPGASIRVFFMPRRDEVESDRRSPAFTLIADTAASMPQPFHDMTVPLRLAAQCGTDPFLEHDPVHLSTAGHDILRQVILESYSAKPEDG